MKFDTEGTYTLQYKAVDECGNETVEDRTVDVVSYRTVLYTDGTFIINEKSTDKAKNEALHGDTVKEYIPYNPQGASLREKYSFYSASDVLWASETNQIKAIKFGSPVSTTVCAYWFNGCVNCTDLDVTNWDMSVIHVAPELFRNCYAIANWDIANYNFQSLEEAEEMFYYCNITEADLSSWNLSRLQTATEMFSNCWKLALVNFGGFNGAKLVEMSSMFNGCDKLETIDGFSNIDTSAVTSLNNLFSNCKKLATLDLSEFDTSSVQNMKMMFYNNSALTTVYVSDKFVTDGVTIANSDAMFYDCSNIKGGAGTTYNSSYEDKTYARIDNPPDAPGYFTLKQA